MTSRDGEGRSRLHSILVAGGALLISGVFGLLLLEGMARIYDGVSLTAGENFVSEELSRGMKVGNNRYDEALGWVLRENHGGGGFRTREYGLRVNVDDDGPLAPLAPGNIVAVGDSFAAGSEVTNAHSWSAYLQRMRGTPVYNGGVGAYGVDQIFLRGQELVERLKPEILLFGILTDDSLRNSYKIYGGAHKPYYDIDASGNISLQGIPVPEAKGAAADIGWARAVFGHSYLVYFVAKRLGQLAWWVNPALQYQLNVPQAQGPAISCKILEKLKDFETKSGVDAVFVVQYGGPEIVQGERHWFGQEVVDCARALDIDMVDTYDALRAVVETDGEEGLKRLYVMHNDNTSYGHMSNAGNELVARVIADYLDEKADGTVE